MKRSYIVNSLVHADFATLAVLISFGTILDLTTPIQLIIMALCEVVCFATNEYISLDILQVFLLFIIKFCFILTAIALS
jgi:hypothetical protein